MGTVKNPLKAAIVDANEKILADTFGWIHCCKVAPKAITYHLMESLMDDSCKACLPDCIVINEPDCPALPISCPDFIPTVAFKRRNADCGIKGWGCLILDAMFPTDIDGNIIGPNIEIKDDMVIDNISNIQQYSNVTINRSILSDGTKVIQFIPNQSDLQSLKDNIYGFYSSSKLGTLNIGNDVIIPSSYAMGMISISDDQTSITIRINQAAISSSTPCSTKLRLIYFWYNSLFQYTFIPGTSTAISLLVQEKIYKEVNEKKKTFDLNINGNTYTFVLELLSHPRYTCSNLNYKLTDQNGKSYTPGITVL